MKLRGLPSPVTAAISSARIQNGSGSPPNYRKQQLGPQEKKSKGSPTGAIRGSGSCCGGSSSKLGVVRVGLGLLAMGDMAQISYAVAPTGPKGAGALGAADAVPTVLPSSSSALAFFHRGGESNPPSRGPGAVLAADGSRPINRRYNREGRGWSGGFVTSAGGVLSKQGREGVRRKRASAAASAVMSQKSQENLSSVTPTGKDTNAFGAAPSASPPPLVGSSAGKTITTSGTTPAVGATASAAGEKLEAPGIAPTATSGESGDLVGAKKYRRPRRTPGRGVRAKLLNKKKYECIGCFLILAHAFCFQETRMKCPRSMAWHRIQGVYDYVRVRCYMGRLRSGFFF